MDINELRIGNIVKIQSRQLHAHITGMVGPNTLYFADAANAVALSEHCSGIQLTERVLEQMGFSDKYVKEGYLGYGENILNQFIIRKPTPEDEYYLWEYQDGGQDCVKYLFYVHEVQNLYFLLWGVELEFDDF